MIDRYRSHDFDCGRDILPTDEAARTANDYAAGIYVVIAAVVSLLTVLTMRETAAKPLVALGLTAPASP